MTSPLLVSADPALIEETSRVAAAAGVGIVAVDAADSALGCWKTANAVLVGSDLADQMSRALPQRRAGVHVVTHEVVDDVLLRSALLLGAETVSELPGDRDRLGRLLGEAEEGSGRGRLLGVIGGSGGAGATMLACAIAQVAGRAAPSVVLDLDPFGPGADRVLGLDSVPGVRWSDLADSAGRLGSRSLREALPGRSGVNALSWAPASPAEVSPDLIRETLSAAVRGHAVVVLDLPRSGDRLIDELALRCDLILVVARPSLASITATRRVVDGFTDPGRLRLVLRGSGISPRDAGCVTGLGVVAEMGNQRGLQESVELGLGPTPRRRGPLARTAARVVQELVA